MLIIPCWVALFPFQQPVQQSHRIRVIRNQLFNILNLFAQALEALSSQSSIPIALSISRFSNARRASPA